MTRFSRVVEYLTWFVTKYKLPPLCRFANVIVAADFKSPGVDVWEKTDPETWPLAQDPEFRPLVSSNMTLGPMSQLNPPVTIVSADRCVAGSSPRQRRAMPVGSVRRGPELHTSMKDQAARKMISRIEIRPS